jgi:O-antigen/teichoic acid export membrane protein
MSTVRTVAQNTTALFIAEVFSQGFRIVYFAILARYIQAAGVGKVSTAQALVSALIVLVSFGFDQLIIRDVAASKARASAYVSNVAFIRLLLSLVFGVLLCLIVEILNYSYELALIIYMYAIAAILKAFTDIGLSIFQAFERMEYNLLLQIFRDSVNIGLSLSAIYLRYSLVVIVGISAFASLLEFLLGFVLLTKRFVIPRLDVDLSFCKRLLLASTPFAVVAVYPLAQSHLNTLILSVSGSLNDVGWFATANTLIMMLMLIPMIFMRAMFPVFSRFSGHSGASLQIAYQKSFIYLLLLGLAISVGTFLTADTIILLVLGHGFEMAVPALRILAWLPLVGFVGHCNGNFLCATGKEKLFMLTEGLFGVVYAMLGFVLTTRFSYIGACFAILAPTVVGFGFYSVLCHRRLNLPLPWKLGLMATLAALLMAACVYYSLHIGVNLLAIVFLIGPAVYGGALYLLRVFSAEDILLLKRALKLA